MDKIFMAELALIWSIYAGISVNIPAYLFYRQIMTLNRPYRHLY